MEIKKLRAGARNVGIKFFGFALTREHGHEEYARAGARKYSEINIFFRADAHV